jgi:hypothetical protein
MPQWYEITRSEDYQTLAPEEKAQAKARFFEKQILPSLQSDDELNNNEAIQYAYEKFMQLPDDTGQGYVTSMLGAAGRGFGEMVPGAIEGVGALTGSEGLREAGQSLRGTLEEVAPVNPIYAESVPVKLAGVGGQALSMLATAGAGGAAGKALGGVGAVGKGAQGAALGSAFLQGAAGGAREAEQYGMTGPEAYLKTLAGGMTEAGTELLPFGMASETALAKRMFAGAPRATTFAGAVGSEFGEESLGQIASNITTKALAPAGVETPGITEGALEAGLYGAFGGGVMGGINALIPTAPEKQTAEQKQWQAEINATPVDVSPPITPEESQKNATEGGIPVVTPDGAVSWMPAVSQAIAQQGPQPQGMPSDIEQRLKALTENPEIEVAARTLNETKDVPFTDAAAETAANIVAQNAEISMQPPVQPEQEAEAPAVVEMPAPTQVGEAPLSEGAERNRAIIADAAAKMRGQLPPEVSAGLESVIPAQPTTPPEDALQIQIPDESLLREKRPEMELQGMGQQNAQPEEVAAEGEEVITPQGTPTPATEGMFTPGGVGSERDATKPEQMTPEELTSIAKQAKEWASTPISEIKRKYQAEFGASDAYMAAYPYAAEIYQERQVALSKITDKKAQKQHASNIQSALEDRKPVSAEAVDTYGIRLPEGYIKQGELYIFQPGATGEPVQAAPSAAQAVKATAPGPVSQGELILEETPKQSASRIKNNMTRFASGMSAIGDLRKGTYARAGHKNYGVGFDVGLLSKNAINELAQIILNLRTQVFIDSGAFSNFKKAIKAPVTGKKVEPLNFDQILAKYDEIIAAINDANLVEETDYPRPMLVMPDVIGNQAESLSLIEKYKNWIAVESSNSTSIPIIPIPLGELSLSVAYNRILEILGSNTLGIKIDPRRFVVGIPSNAEAISRNDLAKFLSQSKPPRIHFLGAAADKNINPLIDVVAENSPTTQVTADASKIRSAILKGVSDGKTRNQAIFDALYQEDDPLVILDAIKKQIPQTTTVATNETAPPSAKGEAVASAELQPVEGSIPTVPKVSAEETVKSTEKSLEAKTPALVNRRVEQILNAGGRTMVDDLDKFLKSLSDQEFNDFVRSNFFEDPSVAIKPTDSRQAKNAKRKAATDALAQGFIPSPKAQKEANAFEQAERELEQEQQKQNAQSISNLFGPKRTNPVRNQVKSADVEQAIGELQNSGEVPSAVFTWRGTSADMRRERAKYQAQFPGAVAAAEAENVEGVFENGMSFIFTDRVVVTDLDRARAKEDGVTPAVAAAKRVLTHENMHKGFWLLPAKQQAQIMRFLREMFPAEELDELAKVYKQYADWRTNPAHEVALLDERLQKYIEETKTIPTDGVWKQFWDYIKEIWRKWTGKPKGEPTLSSMKDVVRLLRGALKNAHKARPDVTVGGDMVLFSYAGEQAIENLPEERRQFMRDSLDTAKAMAAAGKNSEEIRAVTGWFPGKYDGKMRWEVPDEGARLRNTTADWNPLENWLDHPELFKAYPKSRNIPVRLDSSLKSGGVFAGNGIRIHPDASDGVLNILLHEVQHWIQEQEGFATGSSPAAELANLPRDQEVAEVARNLRVWWTRSVPPSRRVEIKDQLRERYGSGELTTLGMEIPDESAIEMLEAWESATQFMQPQEKAAADVLIKAIYDSRERAFGETGEQPTSQLRYLNNAAEIEARDVQARQKLTPEQRRATAPYSSENIAKEDAIVMFGRGTQASISYASESAQNSAAGQQAARSTSYTPRQLEVFFGVRKAYEQMPKQNGPSVPLSELFNKTSELVDNLTQAEFDKIVQDMYADNAALQNDQFEPNSIVILPTGAMQSLSNPALLTMDDAIQRIEGFTADNEDVDSWPDDVQQRFEESAYNSAIQDNDVLAAWELASPDVRDPKLEPLVEIARKGRQHDVEWDKVANGLRAAGKYSIESVDAELAKRLPQDIIDAAQEDTSALDEWVASDEVLADAKKPFIAEVEQRIADAIKRVEDTGRYTWNGSEFEPVEDEDVSVRYSLAASSEVAQKDAEYMAAVESGDMEKAQRMVDAAAKAAGTIWDVGSGQMFHGTRSSFTRMRVPAFFSPNPEVIYDQQQENKTHDYGDQIKSFFLFGKVKQGVEMPEYTWGVRSVEDDRIAVAEGEGYDIIELVPYGDTSGGENSFFVAINPSSIKSADPVTRDDAGNVIPLSQRFQTTSPDIRYSYAQTPAQRSAVSQFKADIGEAAKGTAEFADYEGRPIKDYEILPHAKMAAGLYQDAAARLLTSLENDGLTLQDIYLKLKENEDFRLELGLHKIGGNIAELILTAQILQRSKNAINKARTPSQKAQAEKISDTIADYFDGLSTEAGQLLRSVQYIYDDPRTKFSFEQLQTEKKMKKNGTEAVNNKMEGSLPQVKANLSNEIPKVDEQAATAAAKETEAAVEEDQDAIDLAEGEATLTDKQKSAWERFKDAIRTKGLIAKALKAIRERRDGNKARMSISGEARNAIFQMTEEELIALDKKQDEIMAEAEKAFFSEGDNTAKAKRKKMVNTAKKRSEQGKEVEAGVKDPTLAKVARAINVARKNIKGPSGKAIQWKQLFSQKGSTVEQVRKNILAEVMDNEAFRDMSDDQKKMVADYFAESWNSEREKIINDMIDKNRDMLANQDKKKAAKALNDSRNRILEAVNLGVFDNDELVAILGDKFGIKMKFTEAEKAKLRDLAEKLQDDTLNKAKRNKLGREFLMELEAASQVPMAELMANFWVSSVLSGPNTIISIGLSFLNATGINIVGIHVARAVTAFAKGDVAGAIKAITTMFSDYARHLLSFPSAMNRAWQYLWSGDVSFLESGANDPFKKVNSLKEVARYQVVADLIAKDPNAVKAVFGRFMQFMSRLLTALDGFNVMVTKAGTLHAAMLQSNITPEQIRDITLKSDLKIYKDRIVKSEFGGNYPTSLRDKAYLNSLAEAEMYADLSKLGLKVENQDYLAAESAMTLDPTGVGGHFYNLVRSFDTRIMTSTKERLKQAEADWAVKKDPWNALNYVVWNALNFIAEQGTNITGVRFARFAGNKFNQSVSFIPLAGLLRLYEADNAKLENAQQAFRDSIWRNQIVGVVVTAIGVQLIRAISDEPDDKKRGWFINGGWNNLTPAQKKQKLSEGQREYTLGFGDKVFNYQNWLPSALLAAIGNVSDMIRYSPDEWKSKGFANQVITAGVSGVQSSLEIPALAQLGQLFANDLATKDPAEKAIGRLGQVLAGWAGGFMPRFLKDIDYMTAPDMRRYTTFYEKVASHIPVYRRYVGNDYYDILGNKIQKNAYPGSRDFGKLKDEPEYQMLGALNARGIWLTPANAEYRMVGKGRYRRRLTQEEADAYSLETGKLYKQMILRYGPRALQMPAERAKDYISDKADAMRDLALQRAMRR